MDASMILFIILMSFAFVWFIFNDWWTATNKMPYGKRAKKKFVEKINRIHDVSANEGGVELTYKGKTFEITVDKDIKQIGLEYETIPKYTSKLLRINGEPTLRVHYLESDFKKYTSLEFSKARKQEEIIELVEQVFIIADKRYKANMEASFKTSKPSFYD